MIIDATISVESRGVISKKLSRDKIIKMNVSQERIGVVQNF
jgi:hypothetical protein